MHPHGRAPEETVFHLPPVVPAQRLCRRPSTHLQPADVPDGAAEEDASQVAGQEP